MKICTDSFIRSIRTYWIDGNHESLSEKHGGNGGACKDLWLAEDDCIKAVTIFYDDDVRGLELTLNRGRIEYYGALNYKSKTLSLGGQCLIGFRGRGGITVASINEAHGKILPKAGSPLIGEGDYYGTSTNAYTPFRSRVPDEDYKNFDWFLRDITIYHDYNHITGITGMTMFGGPEIMKLNIGHFGTHGITSERIHLERDQCISNIEINSKGLVYGLRFNVKGSYQEGIFYGSKQGEESYE
jgi:hypothetical protein